MQSASPDPLDLKMMRIVRTTATADSPSGACSNWWFCLGGPTRNKNYLSMQGRTIYGSWRWRKKDDPMLDFWRPGMLRGNEWNCKQERRERGTTISHNEVSNNPEDGRGTLSGAVYPNTKNICQILIQVPESEGTSACRWFDGVEVFINSLPRHQKGLLAIRTRNKWFFLARCDIQNPKYWRISRSVVHHDTVQDYRMNILI